jgi:hypothetical protein
MVFIMLFCSAHFLPAQSFSEWFEQNKTQIKYLNEQIAAYAVILSEVSRGNNITHTGLTFIGDMKQNEFDLHTNYFNSLKAVSAAVSTYSRISDIISYEATILTDFKHVLQVKNMNGSEIIYLNTVYNKMNIDCRLLLDELIDIISDDKYTMTDNDRIKRIDAIYDDMKDKYAFAQSFVSEALLLAAERQNSFEDIHESLLNYGLQ